jgi:hypothetical protein
MRKEFEASCLEHCISIRVGNWIETGKQSILAFLWTLRRIHALRCSLWRRGAVLHDNIVVAIGIKLVFGEIKEVSILVTDHITSTPIVICHDVTRIIGAPKAFANWLT